MKKSIKKIATIIISTLIVVLIVACSNQQNFSKNLISETEENKNVVNLFTPMEKTNPNADSVARNAFDVTVTMAEKKLNLMAEYKTYTAENYQEKTYDDVTLDRVRNNMDDCYLLNPDIIKILGSEGKLIDLSELESAKNLREVVKAANIIDGKLVAIPQEVVAYGLFINKDMFDQYDIPLPNTPEEFLECCKIFKENGIETPIGANRWWLECFVFAQAYADLYNGGNIEAEIQALNSGEKKYSDYMRPSFEFLQKLIDNGYIDAQKAYVSEAIEGEGTDFLAQKTPIVMAYWGAANTETAYGKPDFEMQVIGFPSKLGQMPIITMTGYAIGAGAEHLEDAMAFLNEIVSDESLQVYTEINRVISPSKNIEVDCIPALKPLNDKIKDNVYVLATNASMNLEQWGNTCIIVRNLLNGATVDECMAEFDRLQEEALNS